MMIGRFGGRTTKAANVSAISTGADYDRHGGLRRNFHPTDRRGTSGLPPVLLTP